MWRKRATSAPGFKVPAAYNPLSGQHAPLGKPVERTRIAMMQVAVEDTFDNYVVCRGFDPECGKFFDTVNVAKPYGIRGTNPYVVGQVFAAAKPKTVLGDTPGKAETTVGHPEDLNETVVILTDDDGNPISWLDISNAPATIGSPIELELTEIRQAAGPSLFKIAVNDWATMKVDEISCGDEDAAKVTVLAPVNYEDPLLQLNEAGVWEFHFTLNCGAATYHPPVFPAGAYPSDDDFPLSPYLWAHLDFFYRNVGDAGWTIFRAYPFSFSTWLFYGQAFNSVISGTILQEFPGNEDGETEIMIRWRLAKDGSGITTDTDELQRDDFYLNVEFIK